MSEIEKKEKRKYVPKCIVNNCYQTDSLCLDRSLYKFPNCSEMREKWYEVLKIDKNARIKKREIICDRHFYYADFAGISGRRLKSTAIPSRDLELDKDEVEFIGGMSYYD